MTDNYQFRRAEALRAALNEILRIADRYAHTHEGTYHNAVMEIFGVTCRALNVDAEMGTRHQSIIIRPTEERS